MIRIFSLSSSLLVLSLLMDSSVMASNESQYPPELRKLGRRSPSPVREKQRTVVSVSRAAAAAAAQMPSQGDALDDENSGTSPSRDKETREVSSAAAAAAAADLCISSQSESESLAETRKMASISEEPFRTAWEMYANEYHRTGDRNALYNLGALLVRDKEANRDENGNMVAIHRRYEVAAEMFRRANTPEALRDLETLRAAGYIL